MLSRCSSTASFRPIPAMDMHELTRELHVKNDSKIVMLVADGLGGLPLTAGRQDGAGNGPHAEPRRAGQARRLAAAAFRCCRASRPAAGRGTWACSATIRSSTASAAGRSRRPASASSCSRATSRRAATSARSTPAATSPTAAPAASPAKKARRWRSSCAR